MSSLRKFAPSMNWRIVAALTCVTLAGSPGLAAGRHAPHASQPAAQGGGPGGGASASVPAGQAGRDAGEASRPVDTIDTTVSKTSPKGPVDRGGKTTDSKSVGPIDLTRPDDGYGNLRRRAARPSLIAAQKRLQIATPATVAPHPPASAMVDHPRNAAGAVVPGMSTPPVGLGAAKPGPVHTEPATASAFGAGKNSLGLSATGLHAVPVHVATTPAPTKPLVAGINGTSLHPAALGIGGPAKDHSAIAGSSYRHK
jgi:hypothetical protein